MNSPAGIAGGRRLRILRRAPESIRPATPRPMRRDCHGRLLTALLDRAGAGAAIRDSAMEPWCSATFVGARHHVVIALPGDAARTLAATLPRDDFTIPGHIVADIGIDAIGDDASPNGWLDLSILTIEAW